MDESNACCAEGMCPTPGRCIFCGESDHHVEMRDMAVDDLVSFVGWWHVWCEP